MQTSIQRTQNYNFTQTQLNPFAASRLISALRRCFAAVPPFWLPAATACRLRRQKTRRAALSDGTPCASFYILQGGIPFFAGTHLDDIFYIVYKDLAIADMTGV